MKTKTNSEKLRALADWFDAFQFEQLQQASVVRPEMESAKAGELLGNAVEKGVCDRCDNTLLIVDDRLYCENCDNEFTP